jgi:hypothetical protein
MQNTTTVPTKKAIKNEKFNSLMIAINRDYKIGSNVFFQTLNGSELATVIEHNENKFFGSCSVRFDLGNGHTQTQMFTIND